jgi:hypothetical protein
MLEAIHAVEIAAQRLKAAEVELSKHKDELCLWLLEQIKGQIPQVDRIELDGESGEYDESGYPESGYPYLEMGGVYFTVVIDGSAGTYEMKLSKLLSNIDNEISELKRLLIEDGYLEEE